MAEINKQKFDLEERTAKFGEEVIRFVKAIPKNEITSPLINQLVRSSTSVGANYCEADDAESKKDFTHKLKICKKEARETKHWLRMFVVYDPNLKDEVAKLWNEARELNLIFNAIVRKTENKNCDY
ncbi:MAG: four helix bundle protein [Patescibacteria group bacterium]|jgi:four helix bundle protein